MFLGFHKLKECQGLVEEEKEVATIHIISRQSLSSLLNSSVHSPLCPISIRAMKSISLSAMQCPVLSLSPP